MKDQQREALTQGMESTPRGRWVIQKNPIGYNLTLTQPPLVIVTSPHQQHNDYPLRQARAFLT